MTPIHTNPDVEDTRDLLIEVAETRTARFIFGAAISSNSGLAGEITYEQKNFDISNWPGSFHELFSDRAFTGAGQTFRISLQPGTELTRARVDSSIPTSSTSPMPSAHPPISPAAAAGLGRESRGGQLNLSKRFNDIWSGRISLRGEDVQIDRINNPSSAPPRSWSSKAIPASPRPASD